MRWLVLFLVCLLLTSPKVNAANEKNATGNASLPQGQNAILTMEKDSVEKYTRNGCKLILNKAGQDHILFHKAEVITLPMDHACPTGRGALVVRPDCSLGPEISQECSQKDSEKVNKQGCDKSQDGSASQADVYMIEKNYEQAEEYYKKALESDQDNQDIQCKLAMCYRKQNKFEAAKKIYNRLLERNSAADDVTFNLAYLDMEQKNYRIAEEEFQKIISKNPNCKDAKMGMVYCYIANNQNLSALSLLNQMPKSEEVNYAKASIYYNLGMYSDAKDTISAFAQEDSRELLYQIKAARAITLTPSYTFLNQELNESYDLDLRKVAINLSEYGAKNLRYYLDYGMYVYISGNRNDNHLTNVTNEIRGGVQGRPTEKFEYKTDIGVKVFQEGGAMLNTDSWIKSYINDFFSYKVGFKRNNTEQSYLAAVGIPINGVFTGRISENKAYVEVEGRLPNRYYYFGRVGGGSYVGQNLPTNVFIDGLIGVGNVIYENPENKWFQTVTCELISYNASYQQSLLNIQNPDNKDKPYGGYFSPSFYNADTIGIKLEGAYKKWHIKYGIKGFVGGQVVKTPDVMNPVYGVFPYLTYSLNDHVSVNLSYSFSDYIGIQRHLAVISLNIRGFNSNNKARKKSNTAKTAG